MRRKLILALLLIASLVTTTGAGLAAADAMMVKHSIQGGGAGGDVASSANYNMVTSFQGAVLVQSTSTNADVCSGFLCGLILETVIEIFRPLINR